MKSNERTLCTRCLRSNLTCYCREIRPVSINFQLVILQHPLEYRKSIGTARMTYHSVQNSRLIVGAEFEHHVEVNRLLDDRSHRCFILYPGPGAQDLSVIQNADQGMGS